MRRLEKDVLRGIMTRTAMLLVLIFVPAGTFDYWQGWLFIAIFSLSNLLLTAYLWKHSQKLLIHRTYGGHRLEQDTTQKNIMLALSIASLVQVIVSSLDYRLQSDRLPVLFVLIGDICVMLGFYISFLVFRVNSYASAIIELGRGQKVVTTGPYALVRHPMYAGGLLTFLGLPLALGSWWGVIGLVFIIPLFVLRLLHEESFLSERLSGYREYQKTVLWRLMPEVF